VLERVGVGRTLKKCPKRQQIPAQRMTWRQRETVIACWTCSET
jgi:hypothetical protein